MRILLFNLATDLDDPFLAFTVHWIRALAKYVDHIDVITMRMGRAEAPDNVCVYSVGKEKGYSEPRRFFEFYRILLRLLAQHRYDVCFAHMMPLFAVMAGPILWVKKIPIVLWYAHKSVTLILRLATAFAKRVVTASAESFRIASPKVRVIGHGVDTERFVPVHKLTAKHPFSILSVSRISKVKRIDLLIEAVVYMRQTHPDLSVCVNIVGGPLTEQDLLYDAQLRKLVQQHDLQNDVHFEGSQAFESIISFYQAADCFVNMSETGSVDKAVLEAMSCGVPVIANEVYAGIVDAQLSQQLIIAREPETLGERLVWLMSLSGQERRRLGEELRAIVIRDHALEPRCVRILEEFKELC